MTKKILFIINSLQKKSGTERVAIELANKLIEKDDKLSITIANRDTNIEHVAYPINRNIEVLPLTGNLLFFISKLQKLVKKNSYDFIVVHNMGKLSLVCSLLIIPKNTKLISLEHVAFNSRPKLTQLISYLCYKNIDQVICLTNQDKTSLQRVHKSLKVIPNFSPFPISQSSKDNFSNTIIAIGRLTEQKNFSHLLKAWKIASKSLPNWKLAIYGDGELKTDLEQEIVSEKIINISLLNAVNDIEAVYKNASFIVMSSKFEGLPMVLIEAQTFGLPIVSYDCPHGPKEIIEHGVNGFLVENQNIEELAKFIVKLASSESLLKKMSDNSLIVAEKYQPKAILEQWNNEVFKK